jgi:hypothetical protein
VGKLEEKTLLGRPRRRWEGNIKVDHIEIAWEVFDKFALLNIEIDCGQL